MKKQNLIFLALLAHLLFLSACSEENNEVPEELVKGWVTIGSNLGILRSIYFIDTNTGFAVGSEGLILKQLMEEKIGLNNMQM